MIDRIHSPPAANSLAVLHLVDSLAAGGAERVAVNLANAMPRDRYRMFLGTTRSEGPLADFVSPHVGRLMLQRKGRFDVAAVFKLARFLKQERIQIVHAHSSSLAMAQAASWLCSGFRIVWHDHYGRFDTQPRSKWLFRLLTCRASGVVAVNEKLADWSRQALGFSPQRVWYVSNFAAEGPRRPAPVDLPGIPSRRIACVANLRPQKDHVTLVRAMRKVVQSVPDAHLLLLGTTSDTQQVQRVRGEIKSLGLENSITELGSRCDVPEVLRASSIGVLSSESEGLPLSLLEYGLAGLPPVVTRVGQCSEVVDEGRCGVLVNPSQPEALADGIVQLLCDESRRDKIAKDFHHRIASHYSEQAAVTTLDRIYREILAT